ncbi:MAG TPA: DUF4215 domain-containing protein [Polyangiaceae bacterium]|nr:DUF4215 domain-containing protein [Polyangiaceae bacterium]
MAIGARLAVLAIALCSIVTLQCGGTTTPDNRNNGGGNTSTGSTQGTGSGNNTSTGSTGSGGGIKVPPSVISPDCGNGKIDPGEDCDDSNKNDKDGCNQACRVEADCQCQTAGAACTCTAVCGDGKLSSIEVCDDGNMAGGDGCSADCKTVEPDFQCRVPGKHCVPICGDGKLTPPENCDDSNTMSGDGCSSTCLTEPGWDCSKLPCIKAVCGNGMKEVGESCDKGMQNGLFLGDATGCSKTCTQEPNCREGGMTTACKTPCGDGNIDPGEMCDDGNGVNGDGCSDKCLPEQGFMCAGEERKDTQNCAMGAGQCLVLPITYRDFDGQQATAGGHPDFFYYGATAGGVKTTCVPNASGANLLPLPANGTCPPSDATDPCTGLVGATLGMDGKPTLNTGRTGGSSCACTFTDWDGTGMLTGVAGVATCNSGAANPSYVKNVQVKVIQSADSFKQWYHDDPISTKVIDKLELAQVGATNQYQFSSSNGRTVYDDIHDIWLATKAQPVPAGGATSLSSGFFPLEMSTKSKLCNLWSYWKAPADCIANDNKSVWQQWDPRGWNSGGAAPQAGEALGAPVKPVTGMMRNFYFTSEARYLFRFVGGETLAFFGDDDVWVFINGHLVLDLGAPHERMKGTVTLATTGASAAWAVSVQSAQTGADQPLPGAAGSGTVMGLGLEVGKTYEIAIFHADQHPRESNYQLTLSGFSTNRSVCQPRCGDGLTTATEECDDGAMNNDATYGGCTTQCKFGPFCGDNVKNGDEECDLGRMNGARYGENGCTAGCKLPHRCGDGIIDTGFGEQCDDGANNGMGACLTTCNFKPL